MGILKNVSIRLWSFKEERGLSVDGLARELDMGRTATYQYLRQEGNPSVRTICHMAQRMGIGEEELVSSQESEQARREAARAYLLQLKRELEDLE